MILRKTLNNCIFKITGHRLGHLKCFDDFVTYMWKPVDAACLGVCRLLFGVMMLIDIPEERGGSEVLVKWANERRCFFPLFSNLMPFSGHRMGIVYAAMWTGALGITLGYQFRVASLLFSVTYWYVFLLDTSVWNNHSYLYGLCTLLFMCSDAHRYCSVDAWLAGSRKREEVPFWNYFILKYQFCVMYFVAGAKKLSAEWLSGYAMTNLSYHWVFLPFRLILGTEWTDLLIVHWFGCCFDLTIAFWMINASTRRWATIFCVSFHLMNSTLFSIGMFPWVCLAELPLYFDRDWPRKFCKLWRTSKKDSLACVERRANRSKTTKTTKTQKMVVCLVLGYCFIQALLPYSHFVTQGYNNWTDGIYGYSWDMMVHAWDTILVVIRVRDNDTGRTHYLDPRAFTDSDRWTKHGDQALQYAQCIRRNLLADLQDKSHLGTEGGRPVQFSSENISIFFDVWCSMNGRFQQRMFNPNIDMLRAEWHPLLRTAWVLPLLTHLSPMRRQMTAMAKTVLAWSNYSDVMFVADYPGMTLDNFIATDLENVTLRVLQGEIVVEEGRWAESKTLRVGDEVAVQSGKTHYVTTKRCSASCYMYTFVNKTMRLLDAKTAQSMMNAKEATDVLPKVWNLLKKRYINFVTFSNAVGQSIYHELNKISFGLLS